jgi:CheY-like chemotaxis protein
MQAVRPVVLIVDDDHNIAQTCKAYLEDRGYEILTAAGGREALEQLCDHRVDAVLLDILMPEKDGIETLLEIRKHYPTLQILAMSGGGRIGTEYLLQAAGKLGADAVLRKPFTPDKLIEMLEQSRFREAIMRGSQNSQKK